MMTRHYLALASLILFASAPIAAWAGGRPWGALLFGFGLLALSVAAILTPDEQ